MYVYQWRDWGGGVLGVRAPLPTPLRTVFIETKWVFFLSIHSEIAIPGHETIT